MQKTNIPQTESKSVDLIAQNLEQLKQIFPEVIKEGRVDFEVLNDLLGNYGDTAEERFALNWAGKANARREAQKRSTGTLRPCPEESMDWDNTENLYIEGDNLEVLKLMQKSYHSRIKMIYIDPPYNTGKDFVYKDNYTDNIANYLEQTGQDKKLSTNTESDGRYHSNWLNMMYPRLKLARNLLTDDGVIFISIDDNEVANLRKVCDEIFGEENFVACLPTIMNLKGNNDQFGFAGTHELTLVYGKQINSIEDLNGIPLEENDILSYSEKDEKGAYKQGATLMRTGEAGFREKRPKGYYPIYVNKELTKISLKREYIDDYEVFPKTIDGKEMSWRRSPDNLKETSSEFIIKETVSGISFYKKQRLEEDMKKGKKAKSLFYKPEYSSGNGTDIIKKLFNNRVFDNPKPISLIKDFISIGLNRKDLILDFFSGSATTAHAVMQLNAEDGGNRKYICVQLPEQTPEDSEARKAGYATIPEIAKERIRRAGKKIMEEQKAKAEKEGLFTEGPKKLDTGFKVFKLDSSNINAWDSNPDNLETALNNSLFNIKTDRSEDDLLYEILIKYGIELTEKINRHTIDGKTVYEMGAGSLIVCLADNLSTTVAEGIGKLYKEVSPEGIDGNCRVVFKETGFNGSDEVKTNTLLILKQHGITNVATV